MEMSPKTAAVNFSHQRKENSFLAYEHSVTVKTSGDQLEQQYNNTIKACTKITESPCIILDTRLETGKRKYAQIRLRVDPNRLSDMIQTATGNGRLASKSTHVEDLARPIQDNAKRLSMLKMHRKQLLKLQKRTDNNVDSLIKISSELAKIQADLEQSKGQNSYLMKRIKLDLVRFYFEVEHQNSFLNPIVNAFKNFTGVLSEGIANMIWITGYFLPWIIAMLLAGFIVRWIWRRKKNRTEKED